MNSKNNTIFQEKGETILAELTAVLAKHGVEGKVAKVVLSEEQPDKLLECEWEWACWTEVDDRGVATVSCGIRCKF